MGGQSTQSLNQNLVSQSSISKLPRKRSTINLQPNITFEVPGTTMDVPMGSIGFLNALCSFLNICISKIVGPVLHLFTSS